MAQGTTKGVPIDVDSTLAANSDLLVPSQKAIKTYVDTNFLNPSDLSATTPLTYSSSTGVFTINQASSSANGFLSSTDWSTFNGKQSTLSLTTTGTSGPATLISNTLNIPQYTSTSKSVLFGNFGAGSVGAGATLYAGFVKATSLYSSSQAFQARTVVPIDCVGKNLTVNIGAQPASGSAVFTIRVDGVDSAYTLTVAAGSATGSYQNTSSSLSLTVGGTIDIKVQNNASASTGAVVALSMILEI